MPQIIIETSPNVTLKEPNRLLASINSAVFATGHFTPQVSIKSRLYQAPFACIGLDIASHNAFISITMYLMPGRDDTIKQQLGQTIISTIKEHINKFESRVHTHDKLQISVNIIDLAPSYQKIII